MVQNQYNSILLFDIPTKITHVVLEKNTVNKFGSRGQVGNSSQPGCIESHAG